MHHLRCLYRSALVDVGPVKTVDDRWINTGKEVHLGEFGVDVDSVINGEYGGVHAAFGVELPGLWDIALYRLGFPHEDDVVGASSCGEWLIAVEDGTPVSFGRFQGCLFLGIPRIKF